MSSLIEKTKTLIWYLRQPKGTTLVWMILKRKTVNAAKENTRVEATEWCRRHAKNTKTVLQQLFPESTSPVTDMESTFPEEFSYAWEKVVASPYEMGGQGNIILLYNICRYIQATYVLETGVAYGWSSLAILLWLSTRKGALLVSTDMPYAKMGNKDYVGIVIHPRMRDYWLLFRESDISALPKALEKIPYLDLVHYDSDKSYLGRMLTYPKLYDKLRKGGIFISDDINDNLAFKHFCERKNKVPLIVPFEGRYVGVFIK